MKQEKIEEIKTNDIEEWVKRIIRNSTHGTPAFHEWDTNMWHKQYDDIAEYLKERFRKTLSEVEYYICMLYLGKHIQRDTLYVPFSRSPQYKGILGTCNDEAWIKKGRITRIKQGKTRNIKIRGG